MSDRILVYAPLRAEEACLPAPLRESARVIRSGMGRRRARIAAARGLAVDARGVAVAGLCAAASPTLRTGDVLLGSELRRPGGETVEAAGSRMLAAALRRRGLRPRVGTIASVDRVAGPAERRFLAEQGADGVDMESAWLAEGADGRPLVVLRVVVEEAGRELVDPRTAAAGAHALLQLRRATGVLEEWRQALRHRTILLAAPRSFCAGVERAIEIVELALKQRGAPVYVRKQIVHNEHVVSDLERRGAIFVDELDEVPRGATTVFSAHGVSPAVREEATARGLDVIDATCPLVSKVHAEARRFADAGNTILLIGHEGHEEIDGTRGEAPEATVLVQDVREAERVELPDPERVTYLTQTTLAVDETEEIVATLRERFPTLRGPASDDICYATTNRQVAVREVARSSDVMLVVGSATSSNSKRLVEVSEREQTPAYLVDDETDIDLAWIANAGTIGLSAGASAPEALVRGVIDAIAALGGATLDERTTTTESLRFRLPKEVR
ncbi:MAG TPA: 4-hydroxy-3-methylbut-2-enyl diphosphate reductase [Gaiellaceae bacterium]|jgi:4-hydroxy-3-methylbut-2-enyl diphosphate reductase|nr:4-hydroxy-3-methylbut-2-enyl diphosphate reductase [Gaiellaceae bacterium]